MTGTSVRPAISTMRRACLVSSFTHWSPLTVVTPSTSNLSDCKKTRIACWSLVPGPRASWSTITLIFWAAAGIERPKASKHASQSRHSLPPTFLPTRRCKSSLRSRLELQLQGELNHPRIVHGLVDYAKRRRRRNVLHAAAAASQEELRVIEQVKELCSEIQPHVLAQEEMLDQR